MLRSRRVARDLGPINKEYLFNMRVIISQTLFYMHIANWLRIGPIWRKICLETKAAKSNRRLDASYEILTTQIKRSTFSGGHDTVKLF